MGEVLKRNKAMSVAPLKASQPVGGILAFLGINRSMPMLHGSQGCSAFAKVFFVRHFREPIPLQTTAMDQVSSVMGADDNVVEGLKTVCEKNNPAMVGLLTTGLSETQGTDIKRTVKMFREKHPEHAGVAIIPVNTPDYASSAESGFAAAVEAMIDELVLDAEEGATRPGMRPRQINVLASSMLTPGDIEFLKDTIERFGLRPLVLPDIAGSMDGHLGMEDFSPITNGGTPVEDICSMGESIATLVIGRSMNKAAELLKSRTGVPDYRFDSLMGLNAFDTLILVLKEISGMPVPARIERQRSQLQDAMLDTHFMLGQAKVAIAADADLLYSFATLLNGMGAEVVAALASDRSPLLEKIDSDAVKIGDLEDLEKLTVETGVELLIGNSHVVESAKRLDCQFLRAGFPQYDLVGGFQRTWIGYAGTRQALFDMANLMLACHKGEIAPYRSIYSQKDEHAENVIRLNGGDHAVAAAVAGG